GTVCVVGKMRDLILQLSKSSIYSTKPIGSRALFIADEKIKLTNYEFEIMRLLIKKSGKLISKYEIMKHLHDDIFNQNNNTVEVLIGRLRKKIAPYKCARIENKRGDGYYLDAKNFIDH
uniref:winged helix-turn-helix domain-containing protein n=1 Tax=Klebsiella grimontii TaxID=2058152 RepID=UPI001D0E7F22